MREQGPIDVFVIFAGPDRDRAAVLCDALRATGLRVFSEHDLRPGDKWSKVLPQRLSVARAAVILITARWPQNYYADSEVASAIRRSRKADPPPRLIPVWLDEGARDNTPMGLDDLTGLDVEGKDFTHAATQIAATIEPTDALPPAGDPPRPPRRRPAALAAALAAVLAALVGFAWLTTADARRVEVVAGKARGGSLPATRLVHVPAGDFTMGSTERGPYEWDGPPRAVTLTRPLWVAEHEVTQAEWREVMGTSPAYFERCDDCPVERVNWYEAAEYTNRLSRGAGLTACYTLHDCGPGAPGGGCPAVDGVAANYCDKDVDWTCTSAVFRGVDCDGYRLPTEAEWEHFARAGTKTRFASGETLADAARAGWSSENSGEQSQPVAQKAPNAWGLYDVQGNVREWVNDVFTRHTDAAATDPIGQRSGVYRVTRGGSWLWPASNACSACRARAKPHQRFRHLGFRIVRTAAGE